MNLLYNVDLSLLNFIHDGMKNSFFDFLMPVVTSIGNMGIVWILISIGLIATRKYRKVGFTCLVALALGAVIGEGFLKHLIQRPRPFVKESVNLVISAPKTFSFPSGHTTSSFAAATVISKRIESAKIPAWILAFMIAFSRMYLYVHYPSDVIAGAVLGASCAALALKIKKLQEDMQVSIYK